MIGVFTTWDLYRQRDVVRQTWFRFPNVCSSSPMTTTTANVASFNDTATRPRAGCSVLPLFIMGVPRGQSQFSSHEWSLLQRENATHGDLVIFDATENMNEGKAFGLFQYAQAHPLLSRVPLVAKCDMDTFGR
jgi:hypothetical protein